MRLATELQSEWATEIYTNTHLYTDTEIKIAYFILSGEPFDGDELDRWAVAVYNDSLCRSRTDLDVAVAYDILKERNDQGT
jgi:hypothetical protein